MSCARTQHIDVVIVVAAELSQTFENDIRSARSARENQSQLVHVCNNNNNNNNNNNGYF